MTDGFWVFGYGSLMWRPGFDYVERCKADLANHRRSFCLDSIRYRGTPDFPGLVLALEPKDGTTCRGIAYRISAENHHETHAYLREREMGTYSYREMMLPLTLCECGRSVEALCYVIDQSKPQYRHELSLDERAKIIAKAYGPAGANAEYLFNTLKDLREMQVNESEIESLAERVRALQG